MRCYHCNATAGHWPDCSTITGVYRVDVPMICMDCTCLMQIGSSYIQAPTSDIDIVEAVCVGCAGLRALTA